MSFFSSSPALDDDRVVAAIAAAEKKTSGEIRVVVSARPVDDPLTAAQTQFERMGMTQTAARNGVLIFVAPTSRRFAVIGDRGVHERCGGAFWLALTAAMTPHFARGDFTAAVVLGIERAGGLLAEHFPRSPDDRNELPDSVDRAE